MIIFPLLWMISSWIPALLATRIDAAKILSEE
jgi:ABC-type lipoprotein release transport system permease subunit